MNAAATTTAANGTTNGKSTKSAKEVEFDIVQAEIAKLRAENASLTERLSKQSSGRLSLKVSEKGAVSVYGLGRFPVTLYSEQWDRLLAFAPEIKAFIQANNGKLSHKA